MGESRSLRVVVPESLSQLSGSSQSGTIAWIRDVWWDGPAYLEQAVYCSGSRCSACSPGDESVSSKLGGRDDCCSSLGLNLHLHFESGKAKSSELSFAAPMSCTLRSEE